MVETAHHDRSQRDGTVRLALVGDSIAWGQGAAREEDRPAARLVQALAGHAVDATARVFAVPGARSADLAVQVDRALAWPPTITVIIIGANDLTHLVPPARAAADLGAAVRRLRAADSEVVLAPAPDLSTVAHVPVPLRPLVQRASQELRALQVEAVTPWGARLADAEGASSRAFRDDLRLFSSDRFHPSSAGYAVIASALVPEVLAAVRAVR